MVGQLVEDDPHFGIGASRPATRLSPPPPPSANATARAIVPHSQVTRRGFIRPRAPSSPLVVPFFFVNPNPHG